MYHDVSEIECPKFHYYLICIARTVTKLVNDS